MKEIYKFRLLPERGRLVLGAEYKPVSNPKTGADEFFAEGVVGDDLYRRIEEADRNLARSSNRSFISGWDNRYNKRLYTASEIECAQLFLVHIFSASGAGEEFGTWYTDGVLNDNCAFERKILVNFQTNPHKSIYEDNKEIGCALSSRQVGPLHFPFQRMRKGCDIFASWAGELIVSERLVNLIEIGGFTGCTLNAIWNTGVEPRTMPDLSEVSSGKELLARAATKGLGPSDEVFWTWIEEEQQLPLFDKALREQMAQVKSRRKNTSSAQNYSQLIVQSRSITVASKTLFGDKPFRPGSGESCKCAFGEVRGKALLSPLSVIGSSWDGSDICQSDVYVGGRAGLFRPWRLLVVSKRLFDAMRKEGMKGFDFEIVEMV